MNNLMKLLCQNGKHKSRVHPCLSDSVRDPGPSGSVRVHPGPSGSIRAHPGKGSKKKEDANMKKEG